MSDLLEKCEVCQALLDEEDLFCANCGRQAPHEMESPADTTIVSKHNFECSGCGASMSYDASAGTLRCPFCGSTHLQEKQDSRVLAPRRVVPFTIEAAEARGILRKWLGESFWRPADLVSTASITTITPVYVPYWVFTARTFTYWTADSSQTPWGARGDWYPLAGEHHGRYTGLLVGASSVLTPHETTKLCPFDMTYALPAEKVDLENCTVEQFRVQRKYARPLAREGLETMERKACSQYVPGNCRNLKVNVRIEGLASEPVLLPVWVMAYRYRDQLYRFLINGQTGRAAGDAPFSWRKLLSVIGIVLLIVFVLIATMLVVSGLIAAFS